MSLARLLAAAALLIPAAAFASNTLDVANSSCSGSLASSFVGGVSLFCTGDLLLGHGAISSDALIQLSATGALQLNEVALSGSTIILSAGSLLTIDADSALRTTDTGKVIIVADGGVQLSPELKRDVIQLQRFDVGANATVNFGQPGTVQLGEVPEPASLALVLTGLIVVGTWFRRA